MARDKRKALQKQTDTKLTLTKQNLKFIDLLLKDVKVFDAYRIAGYKGNKEASYQLKHKLKPFIEKYYEIEGLSKEGYKTRLLNLLSLPCVDSKTGAPIDKLSFNQYKEVLMLLRDELNRAEERTSTRPQITAFVIKTYEQSQREQRGQQEGQVIDVRGDVISAPPGAGGSKR